MTGALLILAATTMGIEVGWQPLSDGGVEYIIQIEPDLLPLLADNQDITSEVPADLDVRRYRITVGTGKVQRDKGRRAANRPPALPATDAGSAKSSLWHPREDSADPRESARRPDRRDAQANDPEVDDAEPIDETTANDSHEAPSNPARSTRPLFDLNDEPERLANADGRAGGAVKSRYIEPASDEPPPKSKSKRTAQDGSAQAVARDAESPARPWLPLVAALLALFLSLGVNFYLGWVAWDARREYRTLLEQSLTGTAVLIGAVTPLPLQSRWRGHRLSLHGHSDRPNSPLRLPRPTSCRWPDTRSATFAVARRPTLLAQLPPARRRADHALRHRGWIELHRRRRRRGNGGDTRRFAGPKLHVRAGNRRLGTVGRSGERSTGCSGCDSGGGAGAFGHQTPAPAGVLAPAARAPAAAGGLRRAPRPAPAHRRRRSARPVAALPLATT